MIHLVDKTTQSLIYWNQKDHLKQFCQDNQEGINLQLI